ncbi:hypothetical protein [Brucella pituitosa]
MNPDKIIPEDIMRDAAKWTAQCYQPKTGTWFDVRDVIANAILAERARCASIAKSHAVLVPAFHGEEWMRVANSVALAISSEMLLSSVGPQAPAHTADDKAVPPFNKRGTASSHGQD